MIAEKKVYQKYGHHDFGSSDKQCYRDFFQRIHKSEDRCGRNGDIRSCDDCLCLLRDFFHFGDHPRGDKVGD